MPFSAHPDRALVSREKAHNLTRVKTSSLAALQQGERHNDIYVRGTIANKTYMMFHYVNLLHHRLVTELGCWPHSRMLQHGQWLPTS